MVLEEIVNPAEAKKRPWETFLLGAVYATVGLFLAFWVFREYSSMFMVFLTTLATVPLLYFTIKGEEEADVKLKTEIAMLKEHSKVLLFLLALFLGVTVSLAIWYVVLPGSMVDTLFSSQIQTITAINDHISSSAVSADVQSGLLLRIFLNNVRVLVFSILFSFLYGMGAIFILTWNASVIAAAIGNFVRGTITSYAQAAGFVGLGTYFHVFSIGFLKYAVHGIPEILAYFVGGLAGGIISMAIVRHDLFSERKEKVVFDVAELILLSVAILFFAAILEVYVTPLLF